MSVRQGKNPDGYLGGALWTSAGVPVPHVEYRFAPPRRWRFDYAWPDQMIALEVEGGAFVGGRHTRGAGYTRDMAKYNAAQLLGWRVFRCVPKELLTVGFDTVKHAMNTVR